MWTVQRVPFGIGVSKPPKRSARTGARRAAVERQADRSLDRYLDAVTNARFLIFVATCATLALLLGYLAGIFLYAAGAVAIAIAVIALPVLVFVAGVIAVWLLGGVAGLLLLVGLVEGSVRLIENPAVAIALVFAFGLGAIVLVRGPWTVEAVSKGPDWRAVRWSVRGWGHSRRVVDDVCDAAWRGTVETFQPRDASPPRIVTR